MSFLPGPRLVPSIKTPGPTAGQATSQQLPNC